MNWNWTVPFNQNPTGLTETELSHQPIIISMLKNTCVGDIKYVFFYIKIEKKIAAAGQSFNKRPVQNNQLRCHQSLFFQMFTACKTIERLLGRPDFDKWPGIRKLLKGWLIQILYVECRGKAEVIIPKVCIICVDHVVLWIIINYYVFF